MNTMRDSLEKVLAEGLTPRTHPDAFLLEVYEDGLSITVRAINPAEVNRRFQNLEIFFHEMRRKVREATGDRNWNIRYASQIHGSNLPFLHNGATLMVYIDPMLPYRNPLQSLSGGDSVTLCKLPSQIYYAKPKEEALGLINVQRQQSTSFKDKARGTKTNVSEVGDEKGTEGRTSDTRAPDTEPEA